METRKNSTKNRGYLFSVFTACVSATAAFLILPATWIESLDLDEKTHAAIVQGCLFASGLTGVATVEAIHKLLEDESDEAYSLDAQRPVRITVNNVNNYENYSNTNIDRQINSSEEIISLLGSMRTILMNSDLPELTKEKAITYLRTAEVEVVDDSPDTALVTKNVNKLNQTVESLRDNQDKYKTIIDQVGTIAAKILGLIV